MKIKYILFIIGYLCFLTFMLLHPQFSSTILNDRLATLISFEQGVPCCVYLLHFVAFLPLGFCFSQVCNKKSFWFGFAVLLFYAFVTECLQEYIPPRAFRYEDLTQNIAGILVGTFLGFYLNEIRGKIK
jgi:VanZ family protein